MLHLLLIRCIKTPHFWKTFFSSPFLYLGLVFSPSKLFVPPGGSLPGEALLLPSGWQCIRKVINHFVISRKSEMHLIPQETTLCYKVHGCLFWMLYVSGSHSVHQWWPCTLLTKSLIKQLTCNYSSAWIYPSGWLLRSRAIIFWQQRGAQIASHSRFQK